MSYLIGDDLKEKPENLEEFKKGIAFWKESLGRTNDIKDKAKLHSKIGVHLRIVGHLNESLKYLNKAKQTFESFPISNSFIINEIRIAQTLQFLKRFDEATELYLNIENLVKPRSEFSSLLHFVYQHQGKNYFDQQNFHLAKNCIKKALKIRQQINNKDWIASSVFALAIIEKKFIAK